MLLYFQFVREEQRMHVLLDSITLSIHLFLVAYALILSSPCLGGNYKYCLWNSSTYGGFYFSHPFGKYGSDCSDHAFQLLSCDIEGHPRLNISGHIYGIVKNTFLGNLASNLTLYAWLLCNRGGLSHPSSTVC